MKNKYFYAVALAAAFFLCLTGCGEGLSEKNDSETAIKESSENPKVSSETPSEATTAISTLTPLQTFLRITKLETDIITTDIEAIKQQKAVEKEKNNKKSTEPSDQWFSSHTLFSMNIRGEEQEDENENEYGDDDEEGVFHYGITTETTTTKASVVKPGIIISEGK